MVSGAVTQVSSVLSGAVQKYPTIDPGLAETLKQVSTELQEVGKQSKEFERKWEESERLSKKIQDQLIGWAVAYVLGVVTAYLVPLVAKLL